MRRSFDGLALATRRLLGEDPRGGALFVFANRRCRQLRVLWWDGSGYNLLCRRLQELLRGVPRARLRGQDGRRHKRSRSGAGSWRGARRRSC